MKRIATILALTILLLGAKSVLAQNPADKILGQWYTEENKSLIEIYKVGDKYHGKIVWLKNPNEEDGTAKVDKDNPDEKLRKRPLVGLELMSGLEYDGDNEWEDGDIYDPESGNTYSCYVKLIEKDKIHMRGYMGISLLGRTTTWVRKIE
jgi:uncharacterized protein (DUF2147 family)